MQYLCTWPSLCISCEAPSGRLMGYILGKEHSRLYIQYANNVYLVTCVHCRKTSTITFLCIYMTSLSLYVCIYAI